MLSFLRGCTLRKEASPGDPATADLDTWCLYPGPPGQRTRPASLGLTRDSGPRQVQPDSTSLRGFSVKATVPGCLDPIPSSSGTQAYSGSRDVIASHVREVGGTKLGIIFVPFLFFNLLPVRCWNIVDLQFCACTLCTMDWFTYSTYRIFVLFDSFATEVIEQDVEQFSVLNIRSLWSIYCIQIFCTCARDEERR